MASSAVQMNVGSRVRPAEKPCARLPRVRRAGLAALLLLGAAACRQQPLPEGTAADRDVAAGRRIFERKCASCHNTNGDGKTIVAGHFPNANLIDGIWRSDGSPAAIEAQIRHGHDPMPKFEGKLTDEEIRQTVAYVVVLSQQASPPPAANAGKP
jgi:mono/diheme cytochrome c family protein